LNEAFSLAIGPWRIGLGADVLEAEALARPSEVEGFVARAVVGHDALYLHAQADVVGHGRLEESDGTALSLVLHDLAEGDPRRIVDADVYVFPTWPLTARTQIARPTSIAGDPVADPIELAELFDVDVDQFAGTFALIAPDRLGRLQSSQPRRTWLPGFGLAMNEAVRNDPATHRRLRRGSA